MTAARRRLPLGPRRRPTRSASRAKYQALRSRGHGPPAPCARWPTACSTSPAQCCATAPVSTRTVSGLPLREPGSAARSFGVWMSHGRRSQPGRHTWVPSGSRRRCSATTEWLTGVALAGSRTRASLSGWPARASRTVGRGSRSTGRNGQSRPWLTVRGERDPSEARAFGDIPFRGGPQPTQHPADVTGMPRTWVEGHREGSGANTKMLPPPLPRRTSSTDDGDDDKT